MGAWDAWIGRTEIASDLLTPGLIDRFRATLAIEAGDSPDAGDAAPPGIHWCLCLPDAPTAGLGLDGHPARGGFLPPVPLAARMWASSKLVFHAPLAADAVIERVSEISAISEKSGSTGPLVFVEIDHATSADGVLAVTERQTIVYRDPGNAAAPAAMVVPDLSGWDRHRTLVPSDPLLFRYSALTFNSHRIHYDARYAREAEGYPGLVVQGPLTATLLLDLAAHHVGARHIRGFTFRGVAPAFAGDPLHLVTRRDADGLKLVALGGDGRTIMTASATLG
jgi:3-methylfumaryl-CoA hydratase